ncbi:hypothetical protein FC093_15670 [Ilyomonas limi]|uniref:Lipocalin-like domain-containing protein n=1 Tax=Ilyomonas limi TaxID=2575867 RepID=A0A4U3KWM1_9BACT|nr:hypothetical protein [Ilyomonas limi]TKK66938.1 hypothetical protein FC093_15670 [Ilyomonas limi]
MKKSILLLLVIGALSTKSMAQCDKKTLYTSTKQEWLNSKDEVQKSDSDKITVEVSKGNIVFNHNDDPNDEMKGDITASDCNWAEAYKNGKTTMQAKLTEGRGDVHEANVTIEGKDGKMFIILELKDHPDMKIKAYIDKYEEKS